MDKTRDILFWAGLSAASLLLAVEPVRWLVNTWADPAYQSHGGLFFAVLVGLAGLSVASSPARGPVAPGRVLAPFVLAAGVRLAGQLLAINILAAFALAVDVFAIASFLRLDQRRLAVSPGWAAVFFLFTMPLEPILERIVGFPLQMISAGLSCGMLRPFSPDLVCDGVRLRLGGQDILIDLPCSGASGLMLMVGLWALLNMLHRPGLGIALIGGIAIVLGTLLGNAVRIALLAAGLASGVDTMAPLLHETIGLGTLSLTALPVVLFYRPTPGRAGRLRLPTLRLPRYSHLPTVAAVLGLAVLIVNAPRTPLDVSAPVTLADLPDQLLGHRREEVALAPTEERFFTAYGGTARKARFGPLGLNLVRTSSPLRHLHAPATCLRGMGYSVRFLGTRYDPLPTSVYEATGADGQGWQVAVSFVSADGQVAPGVGEAVWSWLTGASHVWQSVQRITPQSLSEPDRIAFERAALAALDL